MRIDSVGQIPMNTDFGEMLKNLEPGDVVRGRVTDVSGGSVTIRTAAGQAFTAALLAEVELQKGSFVALLINNISDGKAYAEIYESDSKLSADVNTKLSELLGKMKLPVNENNLEAAKLLVKYNLPLDKDTLTSVVSLQKSLASLGESKSEGLVGLLLSGKDIKNTTVDVLNKMVLASEGEVKKLVDSQTAGNDVKAAAVQAEATVPEGGAGLRKTAEAGTVSQTAVPEAAVGKNMPDTAKTAVKQQAAAPAQEEAAVVTKAAREAEMPAAAAAAGEAGLAGNGAAVEEKVGQILQQLGVETNSEIGRLVKQVADTVASIDKNSLEKIVFLLSKDMGVTPKNLEVLENNLKNTKKISDFLDRLQQQVDKYDRQDLKEIKEDIRKLFIKPEQVEDKAAVKEQLKETVKLGEKLESLLAKGGISDPEIRNTLGNLKDNIDFIKNINEYNNYLQIPISINDRSTTTDIYVFKESRRGRKIDPNNATILIALDLKYLGHIESMVNVSNKTVNITFRLEDKSIGKLINSKLDDLKASLEARGYALNPVRVIELEQSFNLLSLEKLINEGNVDRLHFDMKI